ncbi:hypothetical protein AX15_003586 [Amanita polypyramis BW_CC]|nr:hypothetical protein AX15_003586 [Amanita polypyramis BW_CC]
MLMSKMNMPAGAIAVAMVKRQVMIVQAARHHTKHDKYVDVYMYSHFGERVFIASNVPDARISSSDILLVLSSPNQTGSVRAIGQGMLELPQKAFSEYTRFSMSYQKKYERMWSAMTASH